MTARLIIGMALMLAACAGEPTAFDVPAAALKRHPARAPGTVQVSAGGVHTCAVARTSDAYCWGENTNAQLGRGFPGGVDSVPAPVTGGLRFAAISAGSAHTCALTRRGDAYCWGSDSSGMLGNGQGGIGIPATYHGTPQTVLGGLRFLAISAGNQQHTCAVTLGGDAYCWGAGILGRGVQPDQSSVPVPVSGGQTFIDISAGKDHTCGLTRSGDVYCWGDNSFGQLGDGTTTRQASPVLVTGGLQFATISAGDRHTCAVAGQIVYCWGQVWGGLFPQRTAPEPQGTPFESADAGNFHTCGVTPSRAVYCWGENFVGQLGNGTTTRDSIPQAVSSSLRFVAVSAGAAHSCAVGPKHDVYCWGWNARGQLGDNTSGDRLTPVPVQGLP